MFLHTWLNNRQATAGDGHATIRRLISVLLITLTIFSGFGSLTSGVAQDNVPFWGYLYAGESTMDTYTPVAEYQHTSTGEEMTILRNRTGEYIVTLPVFAKTGNVQVTAYGNTFSMCTVGAWAIGATSTEIWVQCWDSTGVLADSQFSLFVSSEVHVAASAYALALSASQAIGEAYTPEAVTQFNSSGGAIRSRGSMLAAMQSPFQDWALNRTAMSRSRPCLAAV